MKAPRRTWSAAEDTILRYVFPTRMNQHCAELLGVTLHQIERRATVLGLRKDPAIVGQLRQMGRRTKQPECPLARQAPEKPRQCPKAAMAGVWYGGKPVKPGVAVNGELARRFMAWVP